MSAAELVVIFPTFEDVATIRKTLPSVIEECRRTDSALIVHDASVVNREEMSASLRGLCNSDREFLIFTSPISMGAARNLCFHTALSLFTPMSICMLEDDHGLRRGAIPALKSAMREYYGRPAPNGLRFGLFSGCVDCWSKSHKFCSLSDDHLYPAVDNKPLALGGANSCFRCAPTSHWQNVLRGYDVDEYPISQWQTRNLNLRNYHRGYTTLYVNGGDISFNVRRIGHGVTRPLALRGWDPTHTASDPRSRYHGKPT